MNGKLMVQFAADAAIGLMVYAGVSGMILVGRSSTGQPNVYMEYAAVAVGLAGLVMGVVIVLTTAADLGNSLRGK